MIDTSIPTGVRAAVEVPEAGTAAATAPRNPGLQRLFEAAAARGSRGPEAVPHPHAWLEADKVPQRVADANAEADAPLLGQAWQGSRALPAGVVVTLVALIAAAAVWLLIFGT